MKMEFYDEFVIPSVITKKMENLLQQFKTMMQLFSIISVQTVRFNFPMYLRMKISLAFDRGRKASEKSTFRLFDTFSVNS